MELKLLYKIALVSLLFSGGCSSSDNIPKQLDGEKSVDAEPHVNYGYNIIVAVDMSNRILNDRRYDDRSVIKLITGNLKGLFQKAIDRGINSKFFLTTINIDDFKNKNYQESVFRIDLTRFGTKAFERANYLHHNDTGKNSLKYDLEILNATFGQFYEDQKKNRQYPADMWYFLQNRLEFPTIDTSTRLYTFNDRTFLEKYRNYVIILTDGYIEAGRYGDNPDMKSKNKLRFLDSEAIERFRTASKKSGLLIKEHFNREACGIIPVVNPFLKDCKFLVLELFDRTVKNGVSTKTPTDLEIMKLFWKDWIVNSGVSEKDVILRPTSASSQEVGRVIEEFLNQK